MNPSSIMKSLKQVWVAWAVLVCGLVLSITACLQTREQIQNQARAEFETEVAGSFDTIARRMERYRELVLALQGLMSYGESISRDGFRHFVANLELKERFPAVFFLYYTERVVSADKDSFERAVRRDTSVNPGGYPDFHISPPGERPEYYVVKYVEPEAGNAIILGVDATVRPAIRKAIERSRDTGQMTASEDFELNSDPERRLGFTMRAPIYRKGPPPQTVEQRRAAMSGVVGAVFRLSDLFHELARDLRAQRVRLRVHEGAGTAAPIFDSAAQGAAMAGSAGSDEAIPFERRLPLGLAGREWELQFSPAPDMIPALDYLLAWSILAGGSFGSILVFALILSMATARARAERVARHMTRDLRESEERYRTLTEMSSDWYWEQDKEFRFTKLSDSFLDRSGVPLERTLGKRCWDDFTDADTNPMWQQHRQRLENHLPFRGLEYQVQDVAGKPRWFSVNGNPVFDAAGNFTGYSGTGREISRRKQTEIELEKSLSVLRATLESTADAILVVDNAGDIIGYNRKFVDLWQMPESLMMPGAAEGRLAAYLDRLRNPQGFAERNAEIYSQPDSESFDILHFKDGRTIERYSQPQKIGGRSAGRVWSCRDVTQRARAEQRLDMQHAVARLLAGSQSPTEVMSGIIRAICETLDWQCGARWSVRTDTGLLKCEEIWHSRGDTAIAEFEKFSREQNFDPGSVGFIRKAVVTGKPVWKTDVASDAVLHRARVAATAGLHGAFAFPILERGKVLGVMEFYCAEIRAPDTTLLEVTNAIGSQIGQFLRRKLAEDSLQFAASHDSLTGLPNRARFKERVDHALTVARRIRKQLGIFFVDLDRFKTINDSQGHVAGDAVLQEVAVRLRGCLRESDTIARQGGDEFVILIADVEEPRYFVGVAEKIRATLSRPFMYNGIEYHLGASIGISTYPGDSGDAETLLKNADIAMYRAKEHGRDNFQFYSEQMNTHSIERLTLESNLRHALERGELLLHYQPKVETRSGKISGVEALLRWQHPDRGQIPPLQFIPMAEETGLILPIGDWVLRTACARLSAWLGDGHPPMRMAVNLSPRQFANPALPREVASALADAGLDAGYLELEITESMVMHNPEQAVGILNEFKSMGVHLSIDDFGIAYSSLSYLKRFPIDSLKIDGSFVKDLPHNTDDAAITRAIIAMAQSLRLKTVAEGVETDAQLAFLNQYGCDEIQGFLFSEPLEESALLEFLKTWGDAHRRDRHDF
jgi:diguanylate cyclase (GGDEF)-like protein/PAS domain S-box-containing protein